MVGLEKSLSAPRHRSKTFLGSLPGFCSDQGNETVRECRAVARLWQSDVALPRQVPKLSGWQRFVEAAGAITFKVEGDESESGALGSLDDGEARRLFEHGGK